MYQKQETIQKPLFLIMIYDIIKLWGYNMLRPYDLLENILIEIDKSTKDNINGNVLAEKFTLSERHLRRLFRFAFNQSISNYIRSRKLAASLDDLLKTGIRLRL